MTDRFLRIDEVTERTGISRTMVYRLMKRNKFPQSVTLEGIFAARWSEREIGEYLEAAKAKRGTPAPSAAPVAPEPVSSGGWMTKWPQIDAVSEKTQANG